VPVPRHAVVCGAGVIGAAVAYFLAQRAVRVTVIERSGVACAASGKSGGFLALDWCDDSPLGPLARASFALHTELARTLRSDYGYRRVDTLMLRARERAAVSGGHRITPPAWLDGAGVVLGALGSTDTTAQLHPALFTKALLDASGAAVRIGCIEDVIERDGQASGVRIDGEVLGSDAVVVALGPWTGRLSRRLGIPRVRGLKGYSVTLVGASVPAQALFVDYRAADGRHFEPEIVPRADGDVYVCGMADPAALPDSPDDVAVDDAACATLARAAATVSTALAGARIDRRQACYRPVTDDGLPLIGRVPALSRAYVATGHGPWGMLNAPATGLALAELIVAGVSTSLDLTPFDPSRR
jgi:glycine/D-amino acid oxidase-like deaminating enzyme